MRRVAWQKLTGIDQDATRPCYQNAQVLRNPTEMPQINKLLQQGVGLSQRERTATRRACWRLRFNTVSPKPCSGCVCQPFCRPASALSCLPVQAQVRRKQEQAGRHVYELRKWLWPSFPRVAAARGGGEPEECLRTSFPCNALGLAERLKEARVQVSELQRLASGFTTTRMRDREPSDAPAFRAQRERVYRPFAAGLPG